MSSRKPINDNKGHPHGRSSSKTRRSPSRTTPHDGNVDTNTLQDEDNETCLRTLSTMDTSTFRRLRENRREVISSSNNSTNGNNSNGNNGSDSRNNRRRNSKNDGACSDYDSDYNRTSKEKGSRGSSSSGDQSRTMSFPQRVSWRVKHHRYRSNYDDDDRSSSSASTWSSTLSTLSSLHTSSTRRSSSTSLSRRTRSLPTILLGLGLVTTIFKVGYVELRLGRDQLRGTTTTTGGVTTMGESKEAAVDRRILMTDNRDYFLPPDMEDDYVNEDKEEQGQGQGQDQQYRGPVQQQVQQQEGEKKQRWSTRLGRMVDMDPSEMMEEDDDVSQRPPERIIDEDDAYQPELVSDTQKQEEGIIIAPPLRGSPEWLELYKAGKIKSDSGAPLPPPPDSPSSGVVGGGGGEVVEEAQSLEGHYEGHDERSGHPPQYSVEEYLADEAYDEESGRQQQQQQPEYEGYDGTSGIQQQFYEEGHDEGSVNQHHEHQEDAETTQLREQFERQLATEVEEQDQAIQKQEEELHQQQEQKEEEERLKVEKEKEHQKYREEHPQYPQFENRIAVKKMEIDLRWQQEIREKEARRQYKSNHPQYPSFKKIQTASPVPAPVSDPNNGDGAILAIPITDIVPIVNTDSNWNTKFIGQSNPQEEEDGTPVNIDEEWEGGGGDAIPITNTDLNGNDQFIGQSPHPEEGGASAVVQGEEGVYGGNAAPDDPRLWGGSATNEVHQEDRTPAQQENQQPDGGIADSEVQQAVQAVGQIDLDKFYSQ